VSDAARVPKLATAADLELRERHEVIRGVLIEKAAPSFEHGSAQLALGDLLISPYQRGHGGPGGWWFGSEVEVELEVHEVYLPDVAGWRRDRVPERPRGRPIRIRPDWVAEVLSPSNPENDLGAKLFGYHRAGVPHYWIIDPADETLTVYRWAKEAYVVHLAARRGEAVRAAPFEEITLEVARLFGG
jgi:Uma2 family endonuclease